jgi:hypothetical protein
MNVLAVSTPRRPEWRWRIVGAGAEVIEESSTGFATITQAVAEGAQRLRDLASGDAPGRDPGPHPSAWPRDR